MRKYLRGKGSVFNLYSQNSVEKLNKLISEDFPLERGKDDYYVLWSSLFYGCDFC